MESKLNSIIKFIHDNLIIDAIKLVQQDDKLLQKRKIYHNLSSFNIDKANNLSLICKNKLIMKKFYDDATPDKNRHGRTLGNENELL
jgi:hypothetical protein